jgi:hypothetical protein
MSDAQVYLKLPSMSPLPKRGFWIVNEDWDCYGYVIPRGFVTDLDSVPHVPIIFVLVKGWARWAALLHDFLYSGTSVTRKLADLLFLRAMLEEGVPSTLAKSMYYAVRALGWRKYNKKRKIPADDRLRRRIADYTGNASCFNNESIS